MVMFSFHLGHVVLYEWYAVCRGDAPHRVTISLKHESWRFFVFSVPSVALLRSFLGGCHSRHSMLQGRQRVFKLSIAATAQDCRDDGNTSVNIPSASNPRRPGLLRRVIPLPMQPSSLPHHPVRARPWSVPPHTKDVLVQNDRQEQVRHDSRSPQQARCRVHRPDPRQALVLAPLDRLPAPQASSALAVSNYHRCTRAARNSTGALRERMRTAAGGVFSCPGSVA